MTKITIQEDVLSQKSSIALKIAERRARLAKKKFGRETNSASKIFES